jgi:hypothetical protein
MAHVIFSRNNDNSALAAVRIMQLAPAAFSTTKADHLTNRYVPLKTGDMLTLMQDYGYQPVQAAQKRSRKAGTTEHGAHMLAFANLNEEAVDGVRPEIVLFNSHDGTSGVRLFAGCFRFICSNGIVAGDGFKSSMYHSKALLGFEDMLRNTVETLPLLMARIEKLRSVKLDYEQARRLAEDAVLTRWDSYDATQEKHKHGVFAVSQTVRDVLSVQRPEDEFSDAFTVLNRIQEGVIRGKALIRSVSDKHPTGMMRKARPVNSVKENIRINSELWNLAEAVAA